MKKVTLPIEQSLTEPVVPAYPLELVASIAATLAANRTPLTDGSHLRKAADEAVILLQACERSIAKIGELTPRQRLARAWSDVAVIYPKESFKREVIRLTKRDTETEAIEIFRKFLVHREGQFTRFNREQNRAETDEENAKRAVEEAAVWIDQYKTRGLGGQRLENLTKEFRSWYEGIYLPPIPRANGVRGGRPKKKKSTVE